MNGYDALLVPVHFYFTDGMDLMWNHLKSGAALPASQVVRAKPRGGVAGRCRPGHYCRQPAENLG